MGMNNILSKLKQLLTDISKKALFASLVLFSFL